MSDERTPVTLDLTEDERRYLAMHARYAASHELDHRSYLTSELDESGVQKTSIDWATRTERHDRWLQIADALYPDPWDIGLRERYIG